MLPQQNIGQGRKYRFNVGAKIKELREILICRAGCCRDLISQSHAARSIGVSMHTVHRAESDGTIPNSPQYEKILAWIEKHS